MGPEIRQLRLVTNDARVAVRDKVAALYPEHELEEFTDLFWERIQRWRNETETA